MTPADLPLVYVSGRLGHGRLPPEEIDIQWSSIRVLVSELNDQMNTSEYGT